MSTDLLPAMIDAVEVSAEANGGFLTPEYQQVLAEANRHVRKVMTASRMAFVNGWTTGIVAALCLPFALVSLRSLVVGAGLALVAWNEFRGRKLLCRFDCSGPHVLGWNQIGLMALLMGYGFWGIYAALTGPNPYADQIQAMPELQMMLGPIEELHAILTLAAYGGIIVFSVIFQGLNALYYFTRLGHLETYLNQTPAWIVDLQTRLRSSGGEGLGSGLWPPHGNLQTKVLRVRSGGRSDV